MEMHKFMTFPCFAPGFKNAINQPRTLFSQPLHLDRQFKSLWVLFISGSLKKMADSMGITYPTVRSRLDAVIEELKQQIEKKDDYKNEILERVSQGRLTPEKAARIIKNL